MRFLYHIFGIIYYIIWSVLGIALIFVLFSVMKTQPWQMMNDFIKGKDFSSVSSVMGSAGNIGDLMQKIQSQKGDIPGAYNSLSKSQQDCLKKELGENTVAQGLAGNLKVTPDLVLKAMNCVNAK